MNKKPNNVLTTKAKVIFTFNDFVFTPDSVFKSKEFTIGTNLWQIIIWQAKMIEPTKSILALGLILKSENIYASLRFDSFIYDSNMKKKCYSKCNSADVYTPRVYQDGWTAFCNRIMTTQEFMAQKDILAPNKRLIIGLNIIVESKDVYEFIPTIISHRKSFNVKEFNDLHIVCGDKEFFVSKAILTSHSDVFEKMFENKMKEQKTNQLIIEDIDGEVFEEFLKFIYFENSDKLEELKENLLFVAEKYQVFNLKKVCENLMFLEICDLNAIQLLITFDKYNCIEMTENSVEFISKNLLEITKNTPNEWKDLMNNKQLLDRITKKMAELIKNGLIGDEMINDCIKSYTYSYIN